jgi:hypothetical protein
MVKFRNDNFAKTIPIPNNEILAVFFRENEDYFEKFQISRYKRSRI